MAFGSWRSASMIFSNHSWNWTIGSGSRSDSSSPALVYSLRRLEASMGDLPAPGSWGAFERADYFRGDPTPVEVSLLRRDLLPPDPTRVHLGRVEGHVAFDAGERRRRAWVEPRRPRLCPILCGHVVVTGPPLPLGVRAPVRWLQMLHPYVLWRDVAHGRVARLENPLCPRGVGERDAAEDYLDLLVHVLEPRRTRVVPDGLLSPTRLYSLAVHGNLLGSDLLRLYGRRTLVSMRWRTIRGRVGSSRVGV